MTKLLEALRILLVAIGFFMAYWIPNHAVFWLLALVFLPLTGLTAIESLFFSKKAALAKGWKEGSPYQTQSALNNLATALAAVIALLFHFNPQAQAAICLVALLFFGLSSLNHLRAYFIDKSAPIHAQRFIFTIFLWVFTLPTLSKVLF